jgi:hypothetical protein
MYKNVLRRLPVPFTILADIYSKVPYSPSRVSEKNGNRYHKYIYVLTRGAKTVKKKGEKEGENEDKR